MFTFLGRFTARRPWLICGAWLAVGLLVSWAAPPWDSRAHDDDIHFLPERCASVRGYNLLEQAFPHDVFASRVVFAIERPSAALSDDDLALIDQLVGELSRLRQAEPDLQIKGICSHRDPFLGKRMLSADGRCVLIQVSLGTPYLALQTRATVDRAEAVVRRRLAQAPTAPALYTTGPAGVGRDLTAAGADSLDRTTVATFLLVVGILLVVYRSPLLALVPLVTIAAAVWVALKLLALCTLIPGFHLVNISQIFAVVMLYGAGTDYCLFLISRYREELARGSPPRHALSAAVGGVGGALAASAGTVVCGLSLMGLAEFAKVRCGGPAIAISLIVALVAALTLTPALLQLLGRAVFWPADLPRPRLLQPGSEGVWGGISRRVAARPVLVWVVAVVLLIPLAVLGLRVQPSYRATGELSPRSSSVLGLAAIQRHFTAGELGPVTVLLEAPAGWDSPAGRRIIDHLSQGFKLLDNVVEVRSLTQPLGVPLTPPPPPPESGIELLRGSAFKAAWRTVVQGYNDQVLRAARTFYLGKLAERQGRRPRYVTRLDVVLNTDPFDPRSAATLELLQTWLEEDLPRSTAELGAVRAECYGVTVNARDLAEVTEGDRARINTLVLGGVFLILLALVRRPGTAAYLLVTVLLSYYATLGATTLVAHYWHARPLGEVDWRVPFFLFTILVAVGEDYNILLISRTLEERRKHGGVEGTRRALAHTGGTITSCGLIMAGSFSMLMLSGLNTLTQIGFALAFGVLLDTFVVRPFLVPAFTLWVWRDEQPRQAELPRPTLRLRRPPEGLRRAG
jgi:RND superfamily putative drug exporter